MSKHETTYHKNSIPSLTGLRFFAAFFVCIAHVTPKIMPNNHITNPSFMINQLAYEGMTLFFVLSGFVIYYNYSVPMRNNSYISIYNFFVSRFARLYPLFFICLTIDTLIHFGYSTLPPTFNNAMVYYLTLTQSWFYKPMGIHSLIFQFGLMPQVAWSVSTEWFFYIAYPLICMGIMKLKRIHTKLIFALIIALFMFLSLAFLFYTKNAITNFALHIFGPIANAAYSPDSFIFWLAYFSPYSRISEFILGCLTASIYMQLSHKKPTLQEENFGLIFLIAAITSIIFIHYFTFNPPNKIYLAWLGNLHMCFGFSLSFASIIFCCARYQNVITKSISNPLFILGGEISYSLYFLHLPIAEAFSRDAAKITSWKVWIADGSRMLLALAAIFGAAFITYRLIEVPARKWIRNLLIIRETKLAEILENSHGKLKHQE